MGPWGGAVALGFVAVAAVAQVGGPEASALGFGAAVVAPAADGRGRWVYVADAAGHGAPESDAEVEARARAVLREVDARRRLAGDDGAAAAVDNSTNSTDGCGGHDDDDDHGEAHSGGHHAHVHKVLVFLFMSLATGALTLFIINHYCPSLPYTLALHGAGQGNSRLQTAPLSVVFRSFRLIFGRAIISRSALEAWVRFPKRARAEHSR